LAVQPHQLRSALIRSVFFPGHTARLQYRELLDQVPDRDSAIEALLAARTRGAAITAEELRDLVHTSRSGRVWARLAQLSEDNAQWVLDNYAGNLLNVAGAALYAAPRATIPRILNLAENATRSGAASRNDPMSGLRQWVVSLQITAKEAIARRHLVAIAAKNYLAAGGDSSVGVECLCLALTPAVADSALDPGVGDTVTMRFGLLPMEGLLGIKVIWGEVRDALVVKLDRSNWSHIASTLRDWIHPEMATKGASVPEATRLAMREIASQMLRDLSAATEGQPGIASSLRALATRLDLRLPGFHDPIFELLYPAPDATAEARQAREALQVEALSALSAPWSACDERCRSRRFACS
jgi:hypothetical protein